MTNEGVMVEKKEEIISMRDMLAERWTETEVWGYRDYPSHYKYFIIHDSVGDWMSSQLSAGGSLQGPGHLAD